MWPSDGSSSVTDATDGPSDDSWEMNAQLRAMRRQLDRIALSLSSPSYRVDPAETNPFSPMGAWATRQGAGVSIWAILRTVLWAVLAIGVTGLTCGLILIGWSTFGERPELLRYGVPIAMGGLGGFFIGVIVLFDREPRAKQKEWPASDTRLRIDSAYAHRPTPILTSWPAYPAEYSETPSAMPASPLTSPFAHETGSVPGLPEPPHLSDYLRSALAHDGTDGHAAAQDDESVDSVST